MPDVTKQKLLNRLSYPRTWAATSPLAWWFFGILATSVAVAGALFAPVLLAGGTVLIGTLILGSRVGALSTLVVLGLGSMAASGLLSRYLPIAIELNSLGVGLVIAVGLLTGRNIRVSRTMAIATVIFMGVTTLSAVSLFLTSPEFAIRGWVSIVAAVFSAVAVMGVTAPSDTVPEVMLRKRRRAVWRMILAIVVLNIVIGLRQAFFGLTPRESQSAIDAGSTYLVGDQIRLLGAFFGNQEMGLFLACFAPAFLALGLRAVGKAKRWYYVLAVLLYVVNFLSLTRTSLIAAVLAGAIALLVWGEGEVILRMLRNVVLALGVGLLATVVLSALNVQRVQDALERALTLGSLASDGSFIARQTGTLPVAWGLFVNNILGSGVGSAGPISQQFPGLAPHGPISADNGYLNIGIQLGIVGVLAFIVMIVSTFAYLREKGSPIQNAGAAAALALLVAMVSASYWNLLAPICLIAALVGLALTERAQAIQDTAAMQTEDPVELMP